MGLADKVREKSGPYVLNTHERLIEWLLNETVVRKLLEAYRDTGLPWVKGFVDELYDNPDDFERTCEKYKISILGGTVKKPGTHVLAASYNDTTDSYKVTLTKNCLDDVDRGLRRDEFETELHEFLIHEETHRQQNQLKSRERPYFDLPDEFDQEDVVRHLSQQVEIDANGRGVAYEASKKVPHDSSEDLLVKLVKGDLDKYLSRKATMVLQYYKKIGGDPWRRFLKKAYEYLDSNYAGSLADYNAWFASHKTVS